jgi:hypothetical protein
MSRHLMGVIGNICSLTQFFAVEGECQHKTELMVRLKVGEGST